MLAVTFGLTQARALLRPLVREAASRQAAGAIRNPLLRMVAEMLIHRRLYLRGQKNLRSRLVRPTRVMCLLPRSHTPRPQRRDSDVKLAAEDT